MIRGTYKDYTYNFFLIKVDFFKYGPKNDGKKNIPQYLRENLEKKLNISEEKIFIETIRDKII